MQIVCDCGYVRGGAHGYGGDMVAEVELGSHHGYERSPWFHQRSVEEFKGIKVISIVI